MPVSFRSLAARKTAIPHEFDAIAGTYDELTGRNPGYMRHLQVSAARLQAGPNARILDLCCGTGLSTQAIASVYPDARITAVDASVGMLAGARSKQWSPRVRFLEGNAMDPASVPSIDPPFDGVLMAYGIRNMPDPDRCLARVRDLLVPGGTACFHEYSVADSRRSRILFNAVCVGIIIPAGVLVGGSSRIYRYLRQSVNTFDGVRAFEDRLRQAAFEDVRTLPSDGWQRGILHTFVARRPA